MRVFKADGSVVNLDRVVRIYAVATPDEAGPIPENGPTTVFASYRDTMDPEDLGTFPSLDAAKAWIAQLAQAWGPSFFGGT